MAGTIFTREMGLEHCEVIIMKEKVKNYLVGLFVMWFAAFFALTVLGMAVANV